MTAGQMKAAMRRLYEEVFNQGKVEVAAEIISADAIDHEEPEAPRGPQSMIDAVQRLRTAFPDLGITVEDMIAEGDRICTRTTMSGTHTGDFWGMPTTGKAFSIQGIDICRFKDGLIVEHWGVTDALSLLRQLEAMPAE
jgi:steroid delta-isomerase-like uncharacterized protein